MPTPRVRRVPDEYAREVFQTIDRHGWLAVVIGVLWDHYDAKRAELDALLEQHVITDHDGLAKVQAAQGALREIAKLARVFESLGQRVEAGNGAGNTLQQRPATVPRRKRPAARF